MLSEEGSTRCAAVDGAGGDGGGGQIMEVHHGSKGDDADAGVLGESTEGLLDGLLHTQTCAVTFKPS